MNSSQMFAIELINIGTCIEEISLEQKSIFVGWPKAAVTSLHAAMLEIFLASYM